MANDIGLVQRYWT